MHKTLITLAFQKAEKDRIKTGIKNPSKTQQSQDISDYLEEECDCRITPDRLKQYMRKAEQLQFEKGDVKIARIVVLSGLSNYLGFTSYEEFKISVASKKEKIKYFISKNKTMLIINLITLITCVLLTVTSGQRWMVWDGFQYSEVSFSIQKLESGDLKLYNADKIRNFKKIANPDCDTEYINEKGEKITWYYKRGRNDLEIFTAPGIHPTNGKTLKIITHHMIQEHICPEY